ncbi:chemotaxis protein CheW [Actinoplanes sp. NPDC049265]|uniref:chemotaxis protein CheW n=1 Tax=Actinoplanes sp. NPDC049265 TaxID=3363902 RepID=UPI00371942DE
MIDNVTAASTSTRGRPAAESSRYLTFSLNGESYALDIFHVKEIVEYRNLTVVPMMPQFIRGVINLRGRAVPVIDLAVRFDRGSTTIRRRTTIIVVHIDEAEAGDDSAGGARTERAGQDIGVLVDAVNKVVTLEDGDMEPPPAFGAGIRADYIGGMARREDEFLIVLDVSRVLSITDMVSLRQSADTAPDTGDMNVPAATESP